MGFIYALCDPETYEVKYIGRTFGPVEQRVVGHVNGARGSSAVAHWIRSLSGPPAHRVLEEIDTINVTHLSNAEARWIYEMREQGYDLVNRAEVYECLAS